MTTDSQPPERAFQLQTYQQLDQYVRAFANGKLNLLWIVGRSGLQKSRAVRAAVGGRVCWIDGNATAFGLYGELYRHRDQPLVLDDLDGLFADRAAIRLLKSLCQTESRKRIGWHSDAATLRREQIPSSFQTTARLLIIANELRTDNVNVAAVQDRGHVVWFDPPAEEVHRRAARWFWNQEIFDFVGRQLHLAQALSMRDYVLAWELKQAQMPWRTWLLQRWGLTGRRLLVAQLKADPSFRTEKERVRAFVQRGGGCRTTYFAHARQLGAALKPVEIRLISSPPKARQLDEHSLYRFRRRFGPPGRGFHIDDNLWFRADSCKPHALWSRVKLGLTACGPWRARFFNSPLEVPSVPSDTTTDAELVQLRLLRNKSPSERLEMALRQSTLNKREIQPILGPFFHVHLRFVLQYSCPRHGAARCAARQ